MSNFDFNSHKIVGVARKKHLSQSFARVYAMGYLNDWHYIPFQENELRDIFKNEGYVHYSKALDKFCNSLIFFNVIEAEGYNTDPKVERFKVNYNGMDYYSHTHVININNKELLENIESNGYDKYYKVDSRIYKITKGDRKKGISKYWQLDDDFLCRNNSYICKNDDDIYIIGDEISDPLFSYSEMLNIQEIVNFVVEIISKHKINPNNFKSIPDGLISMLGIPEKILQYRFEEFNRALMHITLSHNQIMQIASNPLMHDALQRSIKEYEDEYIQMYELRNRDIIQKLKIESESVLRDRETELQKIEKEHKTKISTIEKEIKQKEQERDQIIVQINKRTKEADDIEARFEVINEQKGRLIEDFSVIKDVLGSTSNNTIVSNHNIQREVVPVNNDGALIEDQKELIKHLKTSLKNNFLNSDIAPSIIKSFIGRNKIGHKADVMLFPSIKMIKALLDTLGTYNLLSITVGANWKSYDDLYLNGFGKVIVSAKSIPDKIHILLLQNMNLSYASLYMQPINDVLAGITRFIPTTDGMIEYPTNLWIFGTRTEEEALPMSLEVLKQYCCIERKNYHLEEDEIADLPSKYITMELIAKLRDEEYSYKSYPESYLD
jgi:hypothetical protein